MGKNKDKNKGKKNNSKGSLEGGVGDWLQVDPARVRFQHARIRPLFSGCGRSVEQTLEDIRNGKLKPTELPPIQVLKGPEDTDGQQWYFSLNNRRLWVLKRCREEGLLKDNLIRVRVREPKSAAEAERYTIQNCALEAKFLREAKPTQKVSDLAHAEGTVKKGEDALGIVTGDFIHRIEKDEDEDEDSDDESVNYSNPFSALM